MIGNLLGVKKQIVFGKKISFKVKKRWDPQVPRKFSPNIYDRN